MDLEETEARNDCAGEDQQKLTDWPTDMVEIRYHTTATKDIEE
jgi:hypothetical protein